MSEEFKTVAVTAAKQAGHLLISNFGNLQPAQIETKTKFDFVTWIDKESESRIIDIIQHSFPEHTIYAEETRRDEHGEYRWIIDPLDGTTNYIHDVPVFSVSIALEHKRNILLGVVYDPNRQELFYAERGKGAFLNDHPIHVSSISHMDKALLATGYPFRVKHLIDEYQQSFKQLFLKSSGIRRAGSAAIDLCYIACGRYDGFWELDLKPWDLAAAFVILQEAGGTMTDFSGGNAVLSTGNTIASNGHLHSVLLNAVRDVFKGIVEQ